jgi:hypothetical protein
MRSCDGSQRFWRRPVQSPAAAARVEPDDGVARHDPVLDVPVGGLRLSLHADGYVDGFVVDTRGRDAWIALIRSNGDVAGVLGISESAFLTEWSAFVRAFFHLA